MENNKPPKKKRILSHSIFFCFFFGRKQVLLLRRIDPFEPKAWHAPLCRVCQLNCFSGTFCQDIFPALTRTYSAAEKNPWVKGTLLIHNASLSRRNSANEGIRKVPPLKPLWFHHIDHLSFEQHCTSFERIASEHDAWTLVRKGMHFPGKISRVIEARIFPSLVFQSLMPG